MLRYTFVCLLIALGGRLAEVTVSQSHSEDSESTETSDSHMVENVCAGVTCEHGGTCANINSEPRFICNCAWRYEGDHCERAVVCLAGLYFDDHGCERCPLGTYNADTGRDECSPCPSDQHGYQAITRHTGSDSVADCIFKPVIVDFSPTSGPRSGGTTVGFDLKYLSSTDILNASIAGGTCTNVTRHSSDSTAECVTSAVTYASQGPLRLVFNDGLVSESTLHFYYVDDPVIKSIDRIKTIISGGLALHVRGKGFNTIRKPSMEVTRVRAGQTSVFTTECIVESSIEMRCVTPDLTRGWNAPTSGRPPVTYSSEFVNVTSPTEQPSTATRPIMTSSATPSALQRRRRALPGGRTYNDANTHFYLGFTLDGVRTYINMTRALPIYSQLLVYADPIFYQFAGSDHVKEYHSGEGEFLHIRGDHINYAIEVDDVTVTVGGRACNISLLATNQLTCQPPITRPGRTDTLQPASVIVQVGSLVYQIGSLDYISPHDKLTILLAVIIGLSAVCLLVGAVTFGVCRRRRARKRGAQGVRRHAAPRRQLSSTHYVTEFPARADGAYLVPTIEYSSGPLYTRSDSQRDARTLSALVDAPGTGAGTGEGKGPGDSEGCFDSGLVFPGSGRVFDLMAEVSEHVELYSMVKKYRIDSCRLTLGETIGQGYFGKVCKGVLASNGVCEETTVAVKTVTDAHCTTSSALVTFLDEALVMKDFKHENVLSLVGVVIRFNRPHVVLPYMAYGDLRSYVKDITKSLTVRDLLQFALQVANGMTYLAHLKFVHRDLAARNCMVDDKLTVKIADFGLSRDIYKSDYYLVENKHRPLPVRWMAVESLTSGIFTMKSDVWSYGVVVWELLTRGCLPYPDVDSFNIRNFVVKGHRMAQPRQSPDDIYALLLRCWEANMSRRPSFKLLHSTLQSLLENTTAEKDVEYLQLVEA